MIEGMLNIWCGGTVLADGTAAGGICESLSINGTRLVEIVQALRAGSIAVYDRGNRANEIELSISQQFTTFADSVNALLTLGDGLPVVASLTISLLENSVLYTATLANAGWRAVAPQFVGVSNVTRYTVTGGAFTTSTGASSTAAFLIDGGAFGSAQTDIRDGGNAADSTADQILSIAGSNP